MSTTGKYVHVLWIIGGFLALLLVPFLTHAQDLSGVSLSISPLKNEISIEPGSAYSGTLSISNPTSDSVTVYPLVRDFTPSSDPSSAAPQFTENVPANSSTSLASWVSFARSSLTLAPLATDELDYTITVPKDAEAGGHYAAIFVTNQNGNAPDAGSVSISARIGSLVLLTVPGDIRVKGSVTALTTTKRLYNAEPVTATLTITNGGNIHFVPTGNLVITNTITKQSVTTPLNQNDSSVLPASNRIFTVLLPHLGYGRFVITSTLQGVSPNGTLIDLPARIIVWILPLWAMLWTLLALILFVVLVRLWIIQHDRKLLQARKPGDRAITTSKIRAT